MSPEAPGITASEYLAPAVPTQSYHGTSVVDESNNIELSPQLRADLLDLDAWGEILITYGRTIKVAVALTDSDGRQLGDCHNAQPVWKLVHEAASGRGAGCPFCITTHQPCTAVVEALQTGKAVMARDQAGLTHVAVPLVLGKQRLGAIIAGQVFDRYPEPLSLRRVAKEFGVPAQQLWELARDQPPVSSAVLRASGELLCVLGHAFLRQRYGTILQSKLADANGSFRSLIEGVRDYALFTMDLTGCVTSWNRGAERMLGYLESDIVGRNFSCTFTPEDIQNRLPEKHLYKALRAGRTEDEGWRLREARKQFWASVNITALFEEAGTIRGMAVVIHDATERRKIAKVLEEARLARACLQEDFLSHVSHELRTPLIALYFFT